MAEVPTKIQHLKNQFLFFDIGMWQNFAVNFKLKVLSQKLSKAIMGVTGERQSF